MGIELNLQTQRCCCTSGHAKGSSKASWRLQTQSLSQGGEALLKCFIAETIRLAGVGNSCFWTHVPCLFNMEKSSSLWDIPCGSLPGSKNRESMSFGDSNLEAQKSPGPEFGKCTSVHSEMLF